MKNTNLLLLALYAVGGYFVYVEFQKRLAAKAAGELAQRAVQQAGFIV